MIQHRALAGFPAGAADLYASLFSLAWLNHLSALYYPLNINYYLHVIPNRHSMNTTRHLLMSENVNFIPFFFTIKMPPPRKERIITARDGQDKIVHSVPVSA